MTVSVIIPLYNAAARLPHCLASVASQDYRDLEIILVDDGSTDGSSEICEAALADSRVRVRHQPNSGPSAARNAALDMASGQWIAFVDADDAIDSDYISNLLEVARVSSADLIACDCMMGDADGERRFGMIAADVLYERRDSLFEALFAGRMPWSLWGKLYRADLFEDVHLGEQDYIAEDLEANVRIFAKPHLRVATSGYAGYHYHVGEGSIDHSFSQRHLGQFRVFEEVVAFAHREGIETKTSPEVFYEERMLNCLRKAIAADALTPTVKAAFAEAIARHRHVVLFDRKAPCGLRLRMFATCFGLRGYTLLNRIYPFR